MALVIEPRRHTERQSIPENDKQNVYLDPWRLKGCKRDTGMEKEFRAHCGECVCACVDAPCCHFSHVRLFETPWTIAHKAPFSTKFSRQEYWSGLPFPSPGDLPDPGIKPRSLALEADSLLSEAPGKPVEGDL